MLVHLLALRAHSDLTSSWHHFRNLSHGDSLFGWLADQHLAENAGERLRSIGGEELAVHFINLSQSLQEIAFSNGPFSRRHLIQNQAEGKNIAPSAGG